MKSWRGNYIIPILKIDLFVWFWRGTDGQMDRRGEGEREKEKKRNINIDVREIYPSAVASWVKLETSVGALTGNNL